MPETSIEWTDYSFNPWTGCTKVSDGCKNCYAEPIANRFALGSWGPQGKRQLKGDAYWKQPLAWNRKATKEGRRLRVFCASMADVFEDRPELEMSRQRLWDLIEQTQQLDWLLLTKRPENFAQMIPWPKVPSRKWPNVWLGVSVENQRYADERIPLLLQTPAAVRFISAEPLLGPVDLCLDHECGDPPHHRCPLIPDWVIVGGESGPGARPMRVEWARSLVRQCKVANVSCFVKQLGANYADEANGVCGAQTRWPLDVLPSGPTRRLRDPKGGDPAEWDADLQIREMPQ